MTGNKHIAFLVPMLIGGFIFWCLHGCKGKYKEQLVEENKDRNFWTGYLLSMLSVAAMAFIIFF